MSSHHAQRKKVPRRCAPRYALLLLPYPRAPMTLAKTAKNNHDSGDDGGGAENNDDKLVLKALDLLSR